MVSENLVYGASQCWKRRIVHFLEGRGDMSASVLRGPEAPSKKFGGRDLSLDSGPILYFPTLGHFPFPPQVRSTRCPEEMQDSSLWGHPRAPWSRFQKDSQPGRCIPPTEQQDTSFIQSCEFGPLAWCPHTHVRHRTRSDPLATDGLSLAWELVPVACMCSHHSAIPVIQPPAAVGVLCSHFVSVINIPTELTRVRCSASAHACLFLKLSRPLLWKPVALLMDVVSCLLLI